LPNDRSHTAPLGYAKPFDDGLGASDRLAYGFNLFGVLGRFELEPEVSSFTLDSTRIPGLQNGRAYHIRVRTRFACLTGKENTIVCTPAPQGQERAANRQHAQTHLIYPCLTLSSELDAFSENGTSSVAQPVVCGRCNGPTQWRGYALFCDACRCEYIANAHGDWLDVTRLRFGTCRCCLPKKLLIQERGSQSLRCVHSGKEYIRVEGQEGFSLIEDLPYGLCQCCRPRKPLGKRPDASIRCVRSLEVHRRADDNPTQFVLVPSAPVFDATQIDELLDAGLADICASGISRGRR